VSYPACIYPLMTTWTGKGPATAASSFECR
jgi:hypothetical protein